MAVPVELRQGGEWGGLPTAATTAALLLQLVRRNPKAFRDIVRRLRLVSRTRLSKRLRENRERGKNWLLRIKKYRDINKALSMELLCASVLAHLNSAESVVSLCCSDDGTPYNYAPAGLPDLTAEYAPGIRLVAEVSAKSEADPEFHRDQFDQALRHANDELAAEGADVVYALIVNRGDFGGDPKLQSQYASFVSENGLDPDGDIRLVPMSGKDFASVLMKLSKQQPKDGMRFSPEALLHGFNQIIDGLLQPEPPTRSGWMSELIVRSAWGDWGWSGGTPPPPPGTGGGSGGPSGP